jgi:large subunit ribosomal protein L6
MSKIGMRPVPVELAAVEIKDDVVNLEHKGIKFSHRLHPALVATFQDKFLKVAFANNVSEKRKTTLKCFWGLHRALLNNMVVGLETGFTSTVKIVGLGYKAVMSGSKVTFSLGYSHKIDHELDKDVSLEIDKTGQLLTLRSHDKFKLGNECASIRTLRPPEPYKGTGIIVNNEKIVRKAGKSKKA